jgi:CBS domain-containing protein
MPATGDKRAARPNGEEDEASFAVAPAQHLYPDAHREEHRRVAEEREELADEVPAGVAVLEEPSHDPSPDVVVDGEELLGVVTERDLLGIVTDRDLLKAVLPTASAPSPIWSPLPGITFQRMSVR